LYSLALISVLCVAPTSPEEFLETLCDTAGKSGGAEYWSHTAAGEVDATLSSADSIAAFFAGARDISVDLGYPVLLESDQVDFSYRVSFPDARWSWIDASGRVHRSSGSTIVISADGMFEWAALPPLEGSVSIGPGERIAAGLTLTLLTLMIGAFVLWWVRRRWGVAPKD
jgi:hypothetical protein